MEETFVFVILTMDATIRVATPLILAAMAGLFSERSGIIDISLEGKMLAAAFAAASIAAVTGSAWLGLMGGILAATSLALLHGFACITHNGNQVVSGVAINILASYRLVSARRRYAQPRGVRAFYAHHPAAGGHHGRGAGARYDL